MTLGRRLLIVVVMTVTASAGVLDACLLDCHAQVRAATGAAHAHCHPKPSAGSGAHWQVDPTCHHDHTSAAVESVPRHRVDVSPLAVLALTQTHADPLNVATAVVPSWSTFDSSGPIVAVLPLRI